MFCHNCGKQIPDDTRFCHYCGAAQEEVRNAPVQPPPPAQPVQQPQPAVRQEQVREQVLPGILGALLCSLAGVAVMVLLHKLGYVSSLSGIIMLVCSVWGYAHFGKEMSKKGIILSVLVTILMIYLGHRLCWVIILYEREYRGASFISCFFPIFKTVPVYTSRGRYHDAYTEGLMQQYAFAAAGMIIFGINYVRSNRAAKK